MTAGAMASARRMVVVFIAMEQTVTNVSLRGAEGPAGGSANINMLIQGAPWAAPLARTSSLVSLVWAL